MFEEQIEKVYLKRRELAWNKALQLGFPNRKVEAYKKVPLQTVAKFSLGTKGETFFDVRKVPAPITALSTEEAKTTYGLFLENRFKERVRGEKDFFALLTEAVYEKGLFIYVPSGFIHQEPISIEIHHLGKEGCFTPHIQVFVGRGSKVTFQIMPLVESGMVSQVIDIYMDKNSKCDFIDEATLPEQMIYMNSVRGSLKGASELSYWTVSKGSQFFKQDFRVELLEEGSSVNLKGAAFLTGKNTSHTQILVQHKAPHAKSRQHFKTVVNDSASSTFEGKIFVEAEAQKTEAYQLNNHLLLGKEASAFSKPNLEIFADDVKASHGATVAKLSEEELFYFRTRGISKELASQYLASGFLDEIIKDIPCALMQN